MDNADVVELQLAWWVPLYLNTVALFVRAFGCVPDDEKVVGVIVAHGIRMVAVNHD